MKKVILIICIFILNFGSSVYGVSVLRVEGLIEEVIEGDWPDPLVGVSFEVIVPFDPNEPLSSLADSSSRFLVLDEPSLILGGEETVMSLTDIGVFYNIENGGALIAFSPQSTFGGGLEYAISLAFRSDLPFWDDPESLPTSLEEWRLDEADFSFQLLYENTEGPSFLAGSSSYTHLSITTIPEPSSVLMICFSTIGIFCRKRTAR